MATELRQVPGFETGNLELSQTRFFGGKERGTCIQITQRKEEEITEFSDRFFRNLQLTREQAKALAVELMLFAEQKEVEEIV